MNYEDDLSEIAWNDGWRVGYHKGVEETETKYEARLAVFWTEMMTLNARIDHLERLSGEFK